MAGVGAAPGERRGGRKAGTPNKATAESRALALEHGPAAVAEMARLSTEAESETARISACNAIIDRAYGRAATGRAIVLDLTDTSTLAGVADAIGIVVQTVARVEITASEGGELCGL